MPQHITRNTHNKTLLAQDKPKHDVQHNTQHATQCQR